MGINSFEIIAGPEPKEFYLKQGAVEIDKVESKIIKGRMISKLMMNTA